MVTLNKKRGFTLVELLAVIAILGTIAVIIIPAITKTITRAERETFESHIRGIIRSTNYEFKNLEMLGEILPETIYTFDNGTETSNVAGSKLEYDGDTIQNGVVKINSDGKVSLALYNDKWCATKRYTSNDIVITEDSNCDIPQFVDNSGATTPAISDGMIPITWDGAKWIKASNLNDPYEQNWYDYQNKKWANVALVSEATRNTYKTAQPGTTITEADVMAYLVWIPRYRYKLFNVNAEPKPEQEIEIEFEDRNTSKSNGSTNGSWLTHPAFTFGSEELNGVWVGKFETTGNATTPTVKPGEASLRSQNVSTQFATAEKFNTQAIYGLPSTLDAHMMKNMEWGAVTYLSRSKYGKNNEISINDNSSFYTGGGSSNSYISNTVQSTTGNIYGIYDMSGGAWEYVMGGMYNSGNTTIMLSSSGFNQATIDGPDMEKYIDKYTHGTTFTDQAAFDRRKLGDATGETRGWYGDHAGFVSSSSPWFVRGGGCSYGTYAGAFTSDGSAGNSYSGFGFRLAVSGVFPSA